MHSDLIERLAAWAAVAEMAKAGWDLPPAATAALKRTCSDAVAALKAAAEQADAWKQAVHEELCAIGFSADSFDNPSIAVCELVNRFLTWPLPATVCVDTCATAATSSPRTGTNLLTADEARQMFEHALGAPAAHFCSCAPTECQGKGRGECRWEQMRDAGWQQPAPPNTTPLDEVIAEFEKDPVCKAYLLAAREHFHDKPPGVIGVGDVVIAAPPADMVLAAARRVLEAFDGYPFHSEALKALADAVAAVARQEG